METSKILSLIANALAVIVLAWKTIYDVHINKNAHKKERATGLDPVLAARNKRDRADVTTSITFVALAFCYALLIISEVIE